MTIFQIFEGDNPIGDKLTAFEVVCLELLQDPSGKRIVELDAFGGKIRAITAEEARQHLNRIRLPGRS